MQTLPLACGGLSIKLNGLKDEQGGGCCCFESVAVNESNLSVQSPGLGVLTTGNKCPPHTLSTGLGGLLGRAWGAHLPVPGKGAQTCRPSPRCETSEPF